MFLNRDVDMLSMHFLTWSLYDAFVLQRRKNLLVLQNVAEWFYTIVIADFYHWNSPVNMNTTASVSYICSLNTKYI